MATRAQLRSRARVRADQPGTFPTDVEYNDLLDESAKEVWYDLLGAGWPVAFSSVTVTFSTISQVRLQDFGVTDPVATIRGVFWVTGSTVTELPRLNEGQRATLLSSTGASQPSGYAVYIHPSEGPTIEALPLCAGSAVVNYIPEFAGFSSDSSTWYGPARSDDLIVLLAAMKGMRKEGDDQGARELEREYVRVFEKVTNMASWFDMRNAPTIRDVDGGLLRPRNPFDYDI